MRNSLLYALVVLFLVFMLGCTSNYRGETVSLDTEKSIIEDVESKYPNADIIEIEGVEEFGEYNITNVRVTFNYTSICPVRMRIRYKHPTFGYETGVPTYIVKDCVYRCEGKCVITGEEEAIVASHTLPGTDVVKDFIGDGSNVTARAVFNESAGVWTVTLTKSLGNSSSISTVLIRAKDPAILNVSFS